MALLNEAKTAAEQVLADPNYVLDPTFPAMQTRIAAMFSKDGNTFN